MKILQITLNTYGGIVHYTSQISNALSENNDVYVIAPIGVDTELFDEFVNLIQLHTGNVIKNFLINSIIITRAIAFLNAIKRINPDVIHLQSCHPWICLFLPFLKRYKIVTTIHDVTPHPGSRTIDQKIARNIHIKYSDALIVHGNAAKSILAETAVTNNIFVIPHGDYSFFAKGIEKKYTEEEGNILFLGRIEEYKGLQYLIQAESRIAKSIPNFKIVIAGTGHFKEYEDIKKSSHFELHNYYIQDNDVGEFFQRASVVVLPYIEGTQTGIIPIAYAFKKPVVVTNVGSIPEVVEDGVTGFIVPPKDSDALADVIVKILKDDDLRRRMGENAYRKMKDDLSWDKIADKTIEVYKNVMGDCK
jgi:alpha-maltose-1-phosphate synthase